MVRLCGSCGKRYDDLDHLTICPHNWFPDVKKSPYKEELDKLMDDYIRLGYGPL